jgi:hypothetical protein
MDEPCNVVFLVCFFHESSVEYISLDKRNEILFKLTNPQVFPVVMNDLAVILDSDDDLVVDDEMSLLQSSNLIFQKIGECL